MKPLSAIFEEQELKSNSTKCESQQEELSLIRFLIGGSLCAVEIEKAIEVSEMLLVVHYPEDVFGHEGIVNLRGNIVPVLRFRDHRNASDPTLSENRLLVLEFTPGRRFCTMVSSPKKVSLAQTAGTSQDIVSIDGVPARIVSESDFPAAVELYVGGR
ncbi:MAG: chemotaxis protein CheW [Bacteriovoracia bacterium]